MIGAGPNGLSVGAHLRHAGIEHRVFGRTMGAWRFNMPAGMMLKSEPYASDLSAPGPGFLARDYCASSRGGLPRESHPSVAGAVRRLWQLVRQSARARSRGDRGHFALPSCRRAGSCFTPLTVSTSEQPAWLWPLASCRSRSCRQSCQDLPSDLVSHTSEHASLARIPRQGRPRRRRGLLGPRDGSVAPRARSSRQARHPW